MTITNILVYCILTNRCTW